MTHRTQLRLALLDILAVAQVVVESEQRVRRMLSYSKRFYSLTSHNIQSDLSFQNSSTAKPRAPEPKKTNSLPKAEHASGIHIPTNTERSSTSVHIRNTLLHSPQSVLRNNISNRDEPPNNRETTTYDPCLFISQHIPDEDTIPSSQTQDMTKSCPNNCHRAPSTEREILNLHPQSSSQSSALPLSNSSIVGPLGRSSCHLVNDEHQMVFSSQTQLLDPFNHSPRKEKSDRSMDHKNWEEFAENIIPSSQSQEWELSLLADGNVQSHPQMVFHR